MLLIGKKLDPQAASEVAVAEGVEAAVAGHGMAKPTATGAAQNS